MTQPINPSPTRAQAIEAYHNYRAVVEGNVVGEHCEVKDPATAEAVAHCAILANELMLVAPARRDWKRWAIGCAELITKPELLEAVRALPDVDLPKAKEISQITGMLG